MKMSVSCPICFESFKNSDDIYATECGHTFHLFCLNDWRNRSTACPQCRKEYQKMYKIYLSFDDWETNIEKLNEQIKDWETNFLHLQKQCTENEQLIRDLLEQNRQSEDITQELRNKIEKQTLNCDNTTPETSTQP